MENIKDSHRVEKLIKENGLSFNAFAKDIGESVQTVQNWMKRESVSKSGAIKSAHYFGVTTDYILTGK